MISRPLAVCLVSLMAGYSSAAEEPELAGMITSRELPEISGMAVSRRTKDCYWAHNDSGGKTELYALDGKGTLRGVVAVSGAKNVDWEDMASGVSPNGRAWLWIADTGNNLSLRRGGIIYRVAEPAPEEKSVAAEALTFRWPDGARDCECLLADATRGTGVLITKRHSETPAEAYSFPLLAPAGAPLTLQKLGGADLAVLGRLTGLTAGSVSPDGSRAIVRTYGEAWMWELPAKGGLAGLFAKPPVRVELPPVLQGESIAFTADGRAVLITAERLPAPLYRVPLPR